MCGVIPILCLMWDCERWTYKKENDVNERESDVQLELLPCPDCGADPNTCCIIRFANGRETHNKNDVSAQCTRCGFLLSVKSSGKASVIRRFWNAGTRWKGE